MWRKDDVVQKLKKGQGDKSLRAYARALGCSAAYLSDVYNGRRDPGPKLLDELNLERHVVTEVTYKKKRRWR